ncbi:triple functional domain protein-like [Teleopsis dalmanni]|uniref:triple functional domain protein-like n=1 Tax=Teleopsis dalmanni TaxID=139649 RepID=UPI0018CCFAFC|nr:triple functional domain protein-like [Teleopsis dalmanni]
MSDDDSPRPFRRERNLSNRNFKRRGSNRRYSTESHSSVDSVSLATESKDASNTTSTDDNLNVSKGSSSLQISYSVNSDTENAFNRRSLLKMKPPAEDGNEPQTPEPALLPVRQKVLHFEALQSEDRIIFKTGKYKSKSLQALAEATSHNTQHSGLHLGPLRVLPIFNRKLKQNGETSSNSFHASIDEERSEDEVEDITDFAEDATTPTNEYIVPEIAKELTETSTLSSKPGEEFQSANTDINANVAEYGVDDFGKAESVRRTISADSTPIINIKIENHSSEQDEQNISNTAKKDFPRNFRSTPRPKTEIIGTINRNVKFNSVYAEKDDGEEDEEPQLREKCDKFVHPILEELIKTEETYVENLLMGIQNYGNIFQRADLPIGLRGKKYVLFGNIEQITEFHRDEFLPMLHRNRRDLKRLFLEFIRFIDENCFYSYVIFTMNKQRSLKLCDLYKNYFKMIQSDLDDKLGINSFLVQPIQRMARYPLLLKEFITALFKNREYVMKPLIESCCRLDKKSTHTANDDQ